jgi:la-related protein 1
VWLGAARTELNANNIAAARKLLQRSLEEVPPKNRALVVLECARLEEYAGNTDKSRKILAKARKETKQEWRVFLESVLLEMRAGDIPAAIREAYALPFAT